YPGTKDPETVIKVPSRKFILEVQQRYIEAKWYLSKKNECYRDEGPKEETNWFFCWENLKEIKDSKSRSEDTSNSLITKIKGLFQVLPTKTELHKRKPNIYSDSYCILCTEQEAETLDYLTYETRAVITLRDLCMTVLYKTKQEHTKETYDVIRALTHVYQEGFYRVIWVERYKKICEWENLTGITRAKKKGAEEIQSGQ
ncbi:23074_t:CDS:2, partial [Gigaspora margarita]